MAQKKQQIDDSSSEEIKDEALKPRVVITKKKIGGVEEDTNEQPIQSNDDTNVADTTKEPESKTKEHIGEKVIYTNLDDEVTDIVTLLKKTPQKKISIVIPHRSVLFKSSVNLHILYKKSLSLKKVVTIISRDEAGLTASKNIGFATKKEVAALKKKTDESARPSGFMRGEKPARITNERKSIAEVIHSDDKRAAFEAVLNKVKAKINSKRNALKETRLVFITPNKQALFTLVLVSILLFLSIAYIALPGATITITPRESILESTFNVTFLDYAKNKSEFEGNRTPNLIIPSYTVDPPPFTTTYQHIPTGKISKGNRASGIITVFNTTDHPWDLAPKTRFQTNDGLIFRTPQAVRVPQGTPQNPGTTQVQVFADDLDIRNQVIGSRGNIDPTKFFLPGLQEDSRSKLYAESKTPFAGGVTQVIKIVTEEDVTAATETIKKKIANEAMEKLKNFLEQENLTKGTHLSLITDKNILKIGEPKITVPANIVGQQVDQFEISASYTLTSISYDKQVLVQLLRDRLIHRVDPDKKLVKISDSDLGYRFLEKDDPSGRVKLTITMRAIQVFDLDTESENGKRFVKKITDHILGLRIDAAKDFLRQQTDEIAQVEVKTWPVWAPTIPNIADNIKFEVNEMEK